LPRNYKKLIIEAKPENLNAALGQCAAEMVAAVDF